MMAAVLAIGTGPVLAVVNEPKTRCYRPHYLESGGSIL